jgi:hypothetical protein
MNILFIDPLEFILLTNESIQHIIVDDSFIEYSQVILYTFENTTTNKKLIQANKDWVIFEDNDRRYLFSKNTKETPMKISINYIYNTCVDLVNLKYGSQTLTGETDNVLRSLSENFDYTQIGNVLYGFCKLYDSYVIIKIDERNVITRLTNHCGPTDVRPFENGKYIENFNNMPVMKNSERLFIIDVEQKSIYIDNQFITLSFGLLFVRNLYYTNGQYVTPKRNILQLLSASSKIVVARMAVTNSKEPFVVLKFDEVYQQQKTMTSTTTKLRHFLFISTTNEHDLTIILQQLKTRSAQLIVTSTNHRKFTIVSTCIRMDSFLNSMKNIFLQNSMYMFHDYVFIEFDTFENAQTFTERFNVL